MTSRRSSASLFERGEVHRRRRPLRQRVEAAIGEGVDGALAGLPRLLARVEIAEPGEALGLDVVPALTGPVEHAAAPRHPQQVVRRSAVAPDQAEDLVGEERQLVA